MCQILYNSSLALIRDETRELFNNLPLLYLLKNLHACNSNFAAFWFVEDSQQVIFLTIPPLSWKGSKLLSRSEIRDKQYSTVISVSNLFLKFINFVQ